MRVVAAIVILGITAAAPGVLEGADGFEETLKSLMANQSKAPVAGTVHDFDTFVGGQIAGIGLGSTMDEVVGEWGKPVDMRSGYEGRTWSHYYDNASVRFRDNKLTEITVGRGGDVDCRFTNGLSGTLNRDGVVEILGQPKHSNHAGVTYQIGDNIVSITFQFNRQFPKNEAEWAEARVATVAVQRAVPPRLEKSIQQPGTDYHGRLRSLLTSDAVVPTGDEGHDWKAFRQGRLMEVKLRDSMGGVVLRWGKPAGMSSSHGGCVWIHYYGNAILTIPRLSISPDIPWPDGQAGLAVHERRICITDSGGSGWDSAPPEGENPSNAEIQDCRVPYRARLRCQRHIQGHRCGMQRTFERCLC